MSDVIADSTVTDDEEAPEPLEAPVPDVEVILPQKGGTIDVDGTPATVNRLNMRELLALIRVLSKGIGPGLAELSISEDEDEMQGEVIAMLLTAIPDAADEFFDFVQTVVTAVDRGESSILQAKLVNPSPAAMLQIVEMVIVQEYEDLAGLVGKAQAFWKKTVALRAMRKPQGG